MGGFKEGVHAVIYITENNQPVVLFTRSGIVIS